VSGHASIPVCGSCKELAANCTCSKLSLHGLLRQQRIWTEKAERERDEAEARAARAEKGLEEAQKRVAQLEANWSASEAWNAERLNCDCGVLDGPHWKTHCATVLSLEAQIASVREGLEAVKASAEEEIKTCNRAIGQKRGIGWAVERRAKAEVRFTLAEKLLSLLTPSTTEGSCPNECGGTKEEPGVLNVAHRVYGDAYPETGFLEPDEYCEHPWHSTEKQDEETDDVGR
jgi:hypothetical protein